MYTYTHTYIHAYTHRKLGAITGYMAPHGSIWRCGARGWGHMGPYGGTSQLTSTISKIRVQMGPCDAIWADIVATWGHREHTGFYWAIWAYVPLNYQTAPSNSIWGNIKPYGAIVCHMRPCGLLLPNICVYINIV